MRNQALKSNSSTDPPQITGPHQHHSLIIKIAQNKMIGFDNSYHTWKKRFYQGKFVNCSSFYSSQQPRRLKGEKILDYTVDIKQKGLSKNKSYHKTSHHL